MINLFSTTSIFDELIYQVFLGFIQGITEFLPISSTAHLTVIPPILGFPVPSISSVASIQLGSVAALLSYFRKDLKLVYKEFKGFNFRKFNSNNLLLLTLIGNLPIFIIGFIIKKYWIGYESSIFRSSHSIALVSIIMATFLGVSEFYGRKYKKLSSIKLSDSFIIGLTQVLAIIPGVSRSGVTLTSALFCGIERSTAARFSFILGIPAITLAGIVEINSSFSNTSIQFDFYSIIGIFAAFISSWFSIDFLLKYLKNSSIYIFVVYRIVLGIFILMSLR